MRRLWWIAALLTIAVAAPAFADTVKLRSGKTVTARTLVGLTGERSQVGADRLELSGKSLLGLSNRGWRAVRGAEIGFVLQDALVSLDPLRKVGKEIAEPLRIHGWGDGSGREQKVIELLTEVGVPEP